MRIKNSFFCRNCGLTTIEKYSFTENKYGIVMKGNCKKCGGEVVRLLEDIQK